MPATVRCLGASAERIADDAVPWGAIRASDRASLLDRVRVAPAGNCKARLNMQVSDYGAQQALALLRAMSTKDWACHSARALPQNSTIGELSTCSERQDIYTAVFESYAANRNATGSALRILISNALHKTNRTAARKEYDGGPGTVFNLLNHYGGQGVGFWRDWDELREASSRMVDLLTVRGKWTDLEDDFNQMAPVFEQTFTIRILATLLAERVPDAVQEGRSFTSTLTIEQG